MSYYVIYKLMSYYVIIYKLMSHYVIKSLLRFLILLSLLSESEMSCSSPVSLCNDFHIKHLSFLSLKIL